MRRESKNIAPEGGAGWLMGNTRPLWAPLTQDNSTRLSFRHHHLRLLNLRCSAYNVKRRVSNEACVRFPSQINVQLSDSHLPTRSNVKNPDATTDAAPALDKGKGKRTATEADIDSDEERKAPARNGAADDDDEEEDDDDDDDDEEEEEEDQVCGSVTSSRSIFTRRERHLVADNVSLG